MRFKKPLMYAQGLALQEAVRRSLNFELKWLPGQVSESAVLGDSVAIVVRRIARGHVWLSGWSDLDSDPLPVQRRK